MTPMDPSASLNMRRMNPQRPSMPAPMPGPMGYVNQINKQTQQNQQGQQQDGNNTGIQGSYGGDEASVDSHARPAYGGGSMSTGQQVMPAPMPQPVEQGSGQRLSSPSQIGTPDLSAMSGRNFNSGYGQPQSNTVRDPGMVSAIQGSLGKPTTPGVQQQGSGRMLPSQMGTPQSNTMAPIPVPEEQGPASPAAQPMQGARPQYSGVGAPGVARWNQARPSMPAPTGLTPQTAGRPNQPGKKPSPMI